MEMEGDCLGNRLGNCWATVYGNGRGLFGQPLGQLLGNRLWKWKGTVWATAGQPFMEMEGDCLGNCWATVYGNGRGLFGQPLGQPFMGMVATQLYPFMETVAADIKADGANILQKPNSYLLPFMETVRFEVELPKGKLEVVRTENQRLHIELGNSESEKEFFRQQVQEL